MELQWSSLLLGFSLILCGFLFQESAGLDLQSFSVASILLPIKLGTPELRLYAGRHRFLLLRNAPSPRKLNVSTNAYAPSTPSSSHRAKKGIHRYGGKFHHIVPDLVPPTASYTGKGPAISPSPSPLPSSGGWISSRPLPLPAIPSKHLNVPSPSPTISPTSSPIVNNKKTLSPLPSLTLPPPPPNRECLSLKCTEPLTYTPPGSPCGCVWPIQVRLRFSISLYTFFPLVSELAEEIAAGIPLDRSQVRVIGADAADQQLEKTTVLINLVPLEEMFKAATAFSIYTKFWKRELFIKTPVFGAYEVLYVRYPGLPPSPPSRPSVYATVDDQPYPGSRNDDGPIKPLGVDVPRERKNESSKNMVIIIVLSSVTAFVVCLGFILLFLSKSGCCGYLYRQSEPGLISSDRKPSVGGRLLALRSRPSSPAMSFSSSLLACTGPAKVFSIEDIERATDNFDTSRTLGEGGFGLVYGGILDDGRKVAVKVLKRDDQQGSREFLAEVEMLGRLHHRNLVKLIGICAEDQCRCLVYELVPNGSVESHLHGADKEVAPLDWRARMKIALGAARFGIFA
ncbi:UNVERIFIED_CONTAM: Receptor-like serine/threonine-protein kinase ALE2 [Sesamum radiatum]|uniref:Receptor-like serine/threonine-protein kinase ALE2 n=1 Tax=Sesamum radiatum TaxID=300843 RepID=A0AAW2PI52_SESRA